MRVAGDLQATREIRTAMRESRKKNSHRRRILAGEDACVPGHFTAGETPAYPVDACAPGQITPIETLEKLYFYIFLQRNLHILKISSTFAENF